MIILIGGCSHTGKTLLAQRLLEQYKYPYLSIDHIKMGLIRSGKTNLTAESPEEKLTAYLWPIVKEMVKTAIENNQNLIVEGCYIPFDWKESFDKRYIENIKYICLIMSEKYIEKHFSDIKMHANAIEKRVDDLHLNMQDLIEENKRNLEQCKKFGSKFLLIEGEYNLEIKL